MIKETKSIKYSLAEKAKSIRYCSVKFEIFSCEL